MPHHSWLLQLMCRRVCQRRFVIIPYTRSPQYLCEVLLWTGTKHLLT